MTVLDRVNRRRMATSRRELTAGESPENGLSSTPEAKTPVALRLQAVLTVLNRFVANNADPTYAPFVIIMESLTDEVIEEITEREEATVGAFMAAMGEVIAWIGHGDNDKLPEELRIFAEEISPSTLTS